MSAKLRLLPSAIQWIFAFLVLTLSAPGVAAEQVKNLKPQGYVNDFAGVLNAQTKEKLTALCAEVDQKAKAQIAIVTVSSLEGEPVEQFSIDLATAWGVGPKQSARGILILVAPNDRKYRTEVGYGLEPILPDGKVGGFGREAVPFLRQNDYNSAVLLIADRIAQVIAEDEKVSLTALPAAPAPPPESRRSTSSGWSLATALFWFIVFLFFLPPFLRFIFALLFGASIGSSGRRGGGMWMGGPWYGGGSWGGGGGGGFGGFGGGSFGGGGASGSW